MKSSPGLFTRKRCFFPESALVATLKCHKMQNEAKTIDNIIHLAKLGRRSHFTRRNQHWWYAKTYTFQKSSSACVPRKVKVLPAPVWPYANIVPLYPSRKALTMSFATTSKTLFCEESAPKTPAKLNLSQFESSNTSELLSAHVPACPSDKI